MSYYHFTSETHLPLILASGELRPTESNIDPAVERSGPDVVWLTSREDATGPGEMHNGLTPAKTRVRFEVDVPAIKWDRWPPAAGMQPAWREVVTGFGGAEDWFVWPAAVRRGRWLSVAVLDDGGQWRGAQ